MRIEVYLEIEKAIIKGKSPYGPSPSSIRRRFGSQEDNIFTIRESFCDLTPKERAAMDAAERCASAHGVKLRIYDISKMGDWLRALFKGVRDIPTVIVGRRKLVGAVTVEELEGALEHQ